MEKATDKKRRSLRLRGYDYASAGAYFITLCTQDRGCLFGEIKDGLMHANAAGNMLQHWLMRLEVKFQILRIDHKVVMPNRIHCILFNAGMDSFVEAEAKASLHRVIQWFKTMTTNEYIRCIKTESWPPFVGRLWQRNYYEHVIRGELSLQKIRQYIVNNPAQWDLDRENPKFGSNL